MFVSNVIGISYLDIYSMYISEFNMKINELKDQMAEYYTRLGIVSKGDELMIPNISGLVDMKSFKEVFILFINTPIDSIKPLISKLLITIKLLPKKELDLLNKQLMLSV
jgi:hypothetical protein